MKVTGYIFIDLDGVLADFDTEAAKYPDITPWNVCRTVKGFYTNLNIFRGAFEFVTALETAFPSKVRFLSSSVLERPDAWTEKFLWVQMHFPLLLDRLILVRSKEAVGSIEDILIDDHPNWNGANKFRGTVIKFETSNIPNEYARIENLLLGVD